MMPETGKVMDATTILEDVGQCDDEASVRRKMILKHIGLVRHMARSLIRFSHVEAEFDDLVGAGTIGLINSVDNFDASRGLAFSTFAAPRIRGSMLDDLRRRDHVPRSIRKKQRGISEAREQLTRELDRAPSDAETARRMGLEMDKYWRWKRDTELAARVSLDRPMETKSGVGTTSEEILVGTEGSVIEEDITQREEVQMLRDEILNLKEQQRIVLSLYYFEELKLHEIASILGVTESRISQIRSQGVSHLRERLGHLRVV